MRADTYDVLVLGVGAMGAAACSELARRDRRVLGLEQFQMGHDRGSSHGRSRVIRHAYFEDPRYVPMVREAMTAWRELEARSGSPLLTMTGCINIGPPDHPAIEGVLRSVQEHQLRAEVLSASEIEGRWPSFKCRAGDIGVHETDAGFLCPEHCIEAMIREAEAAGAEFAFGERLQSWSSDNQRVTVSTDTGRYEAQQLILAVGAWLPILGASWNLPLEVERQVQLWFEPLQPALFAVGRMPVFIHFVADAAYYGIPAVGAEGVKIARHHGGRPTTADAADRRVNPQDEADVRGYIRRHLPLADGPLLDGKVCLYTNTPDQHFIVDRLPDHENVVIAGGFSGHGFKFAPIIGRMLADLAGDRSRPGPDLFSLARFRL